MAGYRSLLGKTKSGALSQSAYPRSHQLSWQVRQEAIQVSHAINFYGLQKCPSTREKS